VPVLSPQSPVVRSTAGIRFPLVVFAVWRGLHAIVVLAFGGSLRQATVDFDGGWYLTILRQGYVAPVGGYDEFSNVAFFPGLTWITDAVQFVVRDETAAVLLAANGLAVGAFVAVWGAVRAWGNEVYARRATVALALFPTSYYLWMYYTEALLIAASAAAVWAARRERHNVAAAFMAVAATARLVGVVVGPVLALVRIIRLRRVDWVSIRYVLGSVVGLGTVMLRQAVEVGDPLGFLKAGEAWGREFAGPWTALYNAGDAIVSTLPELAEGVMLDVVAVAVVGWLSFLLWRGVRRGAWPAEPAALATVLWAVPIFSQLIASQVRYMLACWPVLLVVADGWPRLPRWVRAAAIMLPVLITAVLLRRLAHGDFSA
jgi:hypothetical protein